MVFVFFCFSFFIFPRANYSLWNGENDGMSIRFPNGNHQLHWPISRLTAWVASTMKDHQVSWACAALNHSNSSFSFFFSGVIAVIVVPFAGMDMWGMLHTVSRADFIRNTIKILEHYMAIGFEQSKTHGPGARQFVVLFDMAGFNVKQYTWRPAAEVVISLIKSYEANYPEILKCCYIINGESTDSELMHKNAQPICICRLTNDK